MKKLLAFLTTLIASAAFLQAQDLVGSWQGTLHAGTDFRVVLKVQKSPDGNLGATVYSIDQGPDGIEAIAFTVKGADVTFTVPAFQGDYKGHLLAGGKSISGVWTQGKDANPLNFDRATPQTEWPIDPAKHSVQFISVGPDAEGKDVKLEVLDFGGSGSPLVFLTGFGNNAHVFDHFASKFTTDHHVYAITRRGFGASSSPAFTTTNYNADRLGDDVLSVINHLKLTRPVLVGHSIAGEELSSIGSRHPDKVAGLIYLDAGYGYALYDLTHGDYFTDMVAVQDGIAQIKAGTATNQKQALHDLLTNVSALRKDLEEVTAQMASMPDMPPPPLIMSAVQFGGRKYTTLKGVPVLAIFALPHNLGGEGPPDPAARAALIAADTARTSAQAKAFETQVPTARVIRIPDANHYIFTSNEADVLRDMNTFLAQLKN